MTPPQTPETYDAVIIGGGVMGVSIAFNLAKQKFGRVLVLERGNLGMGGTGRSVATIEPLSPFPCVAWLQRRGIEIFNDFAEIVGGDSGFKRLPMAMLIGAEDRAALDEVIEVGQAAGSHMAELTPDEFARLEPGLMFDGVAAVGYSEDAGYADPMMTTNSYAQAARKIGVEIRLDTRVTKINVEGGRVTGVETSTGIIHAPHVILAAGYWTGQLLEGLGVPNPARIVRHDVMVMEQPKSGSPNHSLLDLPLQTYSRPETGDLVLFGALGAAPNIEIHSPDADTPAPRQSTVLNVAERLIQRCPALEHGGIRQGWSGLQSVSPDGQPLLGAIGPQGLFMAVGFSGVGFKIAPSVGEIMARLLSDDHDEAKTLLAPLAPGRVEAGALLFAKSGFSIFN
jgi:glycine/D-amino acid oxidase-like deaminating enzyme